MWQKTPNTWHSRHIGYRETFVNWTHHQRITLGVVVLCVVWCYTRPRCIGKTVSVTPKARWCVCVLAGKRWWRHQMEPFSALPAICAGYSPVTDEFPTQRPVTRGFDVSFDLRLNKYLSKQWWGWWFETPSCPLWRHSNETKYHPNEAAGSIYHCIRSLWYI